MRKLIVVLLTAIFIAIASQSAALAAPSWTPVSTWGSKGSGQGQFAGAAGIEYVTGDSAGDAVWVTDPNNDRIQIFSPEGAFRKLLYFGGWPSGLAHDSKNGLVYATVQMGSKVVTYKPNGDIVRYFSAPSDNHPFAIGVDKDSNIWVSFWGDMTLRKFAPNGNYSTPLKVCSFTLPGPMVNGLWYPKDLDFLSDGTMVVADTLNFRVLLVDPATCGVLRVIPVGTAATCPYCGTNAVEIDNDDRIYVADYNRFVSRVVVYDRNGVTQEVIGSKGTGLGQFDNPVGIAITSGKMYVTDLDLYRVTKYVDMNYPQGALTSYSLVPGDRKITVNLAKNSLTSAVRILVSTSGYAATPTPDAQHYQAYEGTANSFTIAGLQPGTTYFVSTFTRDTNGRWSGPWNRAAKTLIIPNLSFACSKSGKLCANTAFPYGTWVNVYGWLKQPSGTPVSGKTVYIQRYSGGAWRYLLKPDKTKVTAKTNTYGKYLVAVKPVGKYSYRAYFPGGGGYVPALSATKTVKVASSIVAWNYKPKASWTKVHGYYRNSYGHGLSKKKLYVQYWYNGKWRWQKTVFTNSKGYYTYGWQTKSCKYGRSHRVVAAGTSTKSNIVKKYRCPA